MSVVKNKRKLFAKYPLVVIEWLDSYKDTDSWINAECIDIESPKCVSVGWLLKKEKTKYTLCAKIYEDGDEKIARGIFIIPKCNVVTIFYAF